MKHPEQGAGRNRSRWRGQGDEWETPTPFFRVLDEEFAFTLDPCATAQNTKCKRFFAVSDDGLSQDWSHETVFMNPPYGRASVDTWVRKAVAESQKGATVVALVPAHTDAAWWHDCVIPFGAIRFIRGRLPFVSGPGQWNSPFCPIAVVVFGRLDPATVTYVVTQRKGVPSVTVIVDSEPRRAKA